MEQQVPRIPTQQRSMAQTAFIRCPSCGTANRVPQAKLQHGLRPLCGQCKAPLPAGATPVIVTDATFATDVQCSPLPVLLDLWAPWCGPCHTMAPVLDQLATELAGRVRVAKLNVDDNPQTAGRFQVSSIPTLLVLQDGREIDRIVGVQPKSEIAKRLERVMA